MQNFLCGLIGGGTSWRIATEELVTLNLLCQQLLQYNDKIECLKGWSRKREEDGILNEELLSMQNFLCGLIGGGTSWRIAIEEPVP